MFVSMRALHSSDISTAAVGRHERYVGLHTTQTTRRAYDRARYPVSSVAREILLFVFKGALCTGSCVSDGFCLSLRVVGSWRSSLDLARQLPVQ